MTRENLVQKAMATINMLPVEKVNEVTDFANYLLKKHEETILQKGIEKLVGQSRTFEFLNEEEDIYTLADDKEY